jgi:hypothetical protein
LSKHQSSLEILPLSLANIVHWISNLCSWRLLGYVFLPGETAHGHWPVKRKRKLSKFISGQNETMEITNSLFRDPGCRSGLF